jgi:predicted RNA-binding Zn ribbon-like protein
MSAVPDKPVFSLCGGHPVLDLVNSLDDRFHPRGTLELLPDYRALLAFMEQTGLLDHQAVAKLGQHAVNIDSRGDSSGPAGPRGAVESQRAVEAVRDLREAAAAVLYAVINESTPPPADVRKVESYAQSARQHQQLLWNGDAGESKFVWGWPSVQSEVDLPLWMLALRTSELLTSDEMSLVRSCQCDTCRWLFLDTSKNHSRRWCDMKVCGNRMKARRFQARRM